VSYPSISWTIPSCDILSAGKSAVRSDVNKAARMKGSRSRRVSIKYILQAPAWQHMYRYMLALSHMFTNLVVACTCPHQFATVPMSSHLVQMFSFLFLYSSHPHSTTGKRQLAQKFACIHQGLQPIAFWKERGLQAVVMVWARPTSCSHGVDKVYKL
jgi:hypothetical protein